MSIRTRSTTLKEQQAQIEVAREKLTNLYEAMYALTMEVEDCEEIMDPNSLQVFRVYIDLLYFCKNLCKIDMSLAPI